MEGLLTRASTGDPAAAHELLPLVYDELRKLARARMGRLKPGQTLQPTALVHEAYMRLVGNGDPGWRGRGHFFGAAAQAMRNVLVDHARGRGRLKRGGARRPVALDEVPTISVGEETGPDVLELDALVTKLEKYDPRKAEIVSLRFFAGLTHEEIAAALGVTTRTIEREWRFTRAWLQRESRKGESR